MNNYNKYVGLRYGKFVVLSFDHTEKQKKYFLCRCDCGKEKVVNIYALKSGNTKSCGCLHSEMLANQNKLHSKWNIKNQRLMQIWRAMKQRCYSVTSKSYKYYGGKGIKICDEWLNFHNFQEWALSHGYQDNLTIDRHNSEADYCPENCSWETMQTQANHIENKTKWLTYKGKTQSLADWCRELNLDYFRTKARINNCDWSIADAFEKPRYFQKNKE